MQKGKPMIYKLGIYNIILFNEVGSKQKAKSAKSYILALAKLNKFLKKHPTCSGIITLNMYNSRIVGEKWGYEKITKK